MKTLMIASVAALALVAGQASAAGTPNGTGTSYGTAGTGPNQGGYGGGDAVAQWYISGTAAAFCVLGTVQDDGSGNGGNNVTINSTTASIAGQSNNPGDTRSGSTSDGTISINQFQGPNDHANAWRAVIDMHKSICNTDYNVTAVSANGGLKYTGTQVTDDTGHFSTSETYKVAATFDGNSGAVQPASSLTSGGGTLISGGQPSYGDFRLIFDGPADNSKFLLAGTYQDNVLVTMAPVASGTSPSTSPATRPARNAA